MGRKLLFLLLTLFITSTSLAQITAGLVDDFDTPADENGWEHQAGGPNPPTMQTVGGIDGNFIKNISSGNVGAGGKMIMVNYQTKWQGDYITAGIKSISMQVRNNSAVTINLRVAFGVNEFGGSAPHWVSNSVDLTAGSGWTTVVFPITEPYMAQSTSGSSATYAAVMANVKIFRILSSSSGNHKGDQFAGEIDVDNISANDTFLSTRENKLSNAFSISPNPGRDKLNLKLSKLNNNASVEVFDVLGKKIYADRIYAMTKVVNVSQWNNGVYLVRLTTDSGTQTKRFVKQ